MLETLLPHDIVAGAVILLIVVTAVIVAKSIYSIGPTQVGLLRKRLGGKLPEDNPVAFHGEAGYQAELLMPGLRFKLCLVYAVTKHPWIQVPAGQIGIVIAQIGQPLPIGAKSAVYREAFGDFAELRVFVEGAGEKKIKGQKGVQRPVLPPGTLAPIHPVAFLVITKPQVYGVPVSEELRRQMTREKLTFASFGLDEKALDVTRIEPRATESGHVLDMIGVVTTLEGDPLPAGDIASRLGGFKDIETIEKEPPRPGAGQPSPANSQLIETILGSSRQGISRPPRRAGRWTTTVPPPIRARRRLARVATAARQKARRPPLPVPHQAPGWGRPLRPAPTLPLQVRRSPQTHRLGSMPNLTTSQGRRARALRTLPLFVGGGPRAAEFPEGETWRDRVSMWGVGAWSPNILPSPRGCDPAAERPRGARH